MARYCCPRWWFCRSPPPPGGGGDARRSGASVGALPFDRGSTRLDRPNAGMVAAASSRKGGDGCGLVGVSGVRGRLRCRGVKGCARRGEEHGHTLRRFHPGGAPPISEKGWKGPTRGAGDEVTLKYYHVLPKRSK